MENPTTIAVDLSKNVFEIAVERQGRICQRKRLNRRQTITFLSQCPVATVLMETCGPSAHHHRARSNAASTPTTESLCSLKRRRLETARA
jgi:hypothetical protein